MATKSKVEKKRLVSAVGILNLEEMAVEVGEDKYYLKDLLKEYNGCFISLSCKESNEL